MTDLERRALLGDREAQEECTRQGIVLPCPFGTDHKIQVYKYDPCDGYQGDLSRWRIRCECGICLEDENLEKLKGKWNTRTAPPIGRCGTCKHRTKETQWTRSGFCGRRGAGDFFVAKPDGFCNYYEPREADK